VVSRCPNYCSGVHWYIYFRPRPLWENLFGDSAYFSLSLRSPCILSFKSSIVDSVPLNPPSGVLLGNTCINILAQIIRFGIVG
jgi:hypothetical protein